ncbi:unnamed protein product, partial [Effrenium voratum]
QDAATLKTGDIEACKELCRCNGWFGFTYWEDRAYFRSQDRQSLLRNKRPSSGSILFIRPEVSNLQHAILDAGMPEMPEMPETPAQRTRGHLFVLLQIQWPAMHCKVELESEDLEEFELCDLDVAESQEQQKLTGFAMSSYVNVDTDRGGSLDAKEMDANESDASHEGKVVGVADVAEVALVCMACPDGRT